MPRLFLPLPLREGTVVSLPADSAHRLREVLRVRPGDALTLFDGTGGEHAAQVTTVTRAGIDVAIGAYHAVERESPLTITLAQGLARGERMDIVIQKAVELGVARIVPLATIRSQVRLDPARTARRLAHWQAIVTQACEQCGRNRVPQVDGPTTIEAFVAGDTASLRLVLAPSGDVSLPATLPHAMSISLVIGPEGGLSDDEIRFLTNAGYQHVRLGPRTLRTETAALVAISALQARWGDLG
jgi:16S rRNA (uracil1498-N3)-methyltransferase